MCISLSPSYLTQASWMLIIASFLLIHYAIFDVKVPGLSKCFWLSQIFLVWMYIAAIPSILCDSPILCGFYFRSPYTDDQISPPKSNLIVLEFEEWKCMNGVPIILSFPWSLSSQLTRSYTNDQTHYSQTSLSRMLFGA